LKIYIVSAAYIASPRTQLSSHVIELTRELAKLGNEVIVLTMGFDDLSEEEIITLEDPFNTDVKKRKCSVKVYRFFVRDSNKIKSPFEGTKLEEIKRIEEFGNKAVKFLLSKKIKEKVIVHLHGHSIIPSFAKDLRKNENLIIVSSIHTFDSIAEAKKAEDGAGPYIIEYLKEKEKQALEYSHTVIVRSKPVYDEISYIFPEVVNKQNIKIIPSGVSSVFIHYPHLSREEIEEVKREYKIKGKFIFMLNKLEPSKGIEYALEAFNNINRKKIENVSMLIAGVFEKKNEWYLDRLKKYIKHKELENYVKIKLDITEEDKIKLFNVADVFVLSSIIEPFGNTIIEALSKDVPVVISGVEGPKDIFNIERVKIPFTETDFGAVVFYDDPTKRAEFFSKAILKVLSENEKFKEKIKSKKEKIISKYNWEVLVNEKLKIYKHLLKSLR
jgi:glycosyltransferase involved in cell wall biosynthesis